MKIGPFTRFNRNDYRNLPDAFYEVLDNLNPLVDTLNKLLQGNIDIDNNMLAERQLVSVEHAVPVTLRMRKLRTPPFLVRAGYSSGNRVAAANITQINSDGTVQVVVDFLSPAPTGPVEVVLVFEP